MNPWPQSPAQSVTGKCNLARRVAAVAVAAMALLTGLGCARLVGDGPNAAAASESSGRHFLFKRWNLEDASRVLVLAEARPDGLVLRDVATGGGASDALCVVNGRAFMRSYEGPWAIDLATGQRHGIPSFSRSGPSCFDSDQLYSIFRGTDAYTVRLYDFAKGAYRDVTQLPYPLRPGYHLNGPMAVSPDHKRLAFCRSKEPLWIGGFLMAVVDLDTGACRDVGPRLRYDCFSSFRHPPFVWLDPETLLVVRSFRPPGAEREAEERIIDPGPIGEAYLLTVISAVTGESRDVLTLPGSGMRGATLEPPTRDGSARVRLASGRYRIDMERAKLVEDDDTGQSFNRIPEDFGEAILHGDKRLDSVNRRLTGSYYPKLTDPIVSPEGQRALWGISDMQFPRCKLKYYDAREEKVRIVTDTWEANWVLWVDAKDLEAPPEEPAIPDGWTSIFPADDTPPPEATQQKTPPRKRMQDYVKFTMTSDKEHYRLHEPVEITLSITNISDTDVEVVRPYPDDRTVSAMLSEGRGGSSGRFFGEPLTAEQTRDRVILKAGDTISETGTFEFATPDSYRISGRYGLLDHVLLGGADAAVEFTIAPSPDDDTLLRTKLDSLVAQLREECAKEMTVIRTSRGASPEKTSQRIEGILGAMGRVGPSARPYLIAAVRAEEDERVLLKLYRPLTDMRSSSALPLYEKRLANGTTAEKSLICYGLRNLLEDPPSHDKALHLLISALGDQEPAVRLEAAKFLGRQRDPLLTGAFEKALREDQEPAVRVAAAKFLGRQRAPALKAALEKALRDEDEKVRETAAWCLAKGEGLELAEWLNQVAKEPTRARYMAARQAVKELEAYLHDTRGELPTDDWDTVADDRKALRQFRDTVRAWAAWAEKNPRYSAKFF
jgi:HEAT repeats